VSIDLVSDPEAEGSQWLAVTLRLGGEIEKILEMEQACRQALRNKLRPDEYQRFALSYDIPE